MKISPMTLALLKNFSGINKGIVLRKGKPISTISEGETIFALAEVPEQFPCDVGIYDLQEFLGTLSLFESPVLDFDSDNQSNFTLISEENGKSSVKYRFNDTSLITSPSDVYEIPSVEVEFDLRHQDLQKLMKAVAILNLDDIVVRGNGSDVSIIARDSKNTLSNFYELDLPVKSSANFQFIVKAENMKMVMGSYKVRCSKEGSISFELVVPEEQSGSLSYLIALQENSTYAE